MTITMKPETRDAILRAIPTDMTVTISQIAAEVGVNNNTVRSYVEQMKTDGWLEITTGFPARATHVRKLWADTFFEARPLPQMIEFDNGIIVGPFCVNCGWPFTHHGGTRSRCPANVNVLLGGRNAKEAGSR